MIFAAIAIVYVAAIPVAYVYLVYRDEYEMFAPDEYGRDGPWLLLVLSAAWLPVWMVYLAVLFCENVGGYVQRVVELPYRLASRIVRK